jgi:hypothetical protein
MSYAGTLPGAEHQLPLLRFGQPQVDGNVRDCQDLPGSPEADLAPVSTHQLCFVTCMHFVGCKTLGGTSCA